MSIFSRIVRCLVPRPRLPRTPTHLSLRPPEVQIVPPPDTAALPPSSIPNWIPQPWHGFCSSSGNSRWIPLESRHPFPSTKGISSQTLRSDKNQRFTLITWNVNAFRPHPRDRFTALLSYILLHSPAADVIFLQEVSRPALNILTEDPRIRTSWFITDIDSKHWGGQPYGTITLFSKARFHQNPKYTTGSMVLGSVGRIRYTSRYNRDALCCDVHIVPPQSKDSGLREESTCIRLVNVHLDSLAIEPSHRPGQLATVAKALREAGCGLVAGDFNPVLPEDQTLVEDNGLLDAWIDVYGTTSGYTTGGIRYRPRRMDKVATIGLEVESIDVLRPGVVSLDLKDWDHSADEPQTYTAKSVIPWSDHSGLRCTLVWPRRHREEL